MQWLAKRGEGKDMDNSLPLPPCIKKYKNKIKKNVFEWGIWFHWLTITSQGNDWTRKIKKSKQLTDSESRNSVNSSVKNVKQAKTKPKITEQSNQFKRVKLKFPNFYRLRPSKFTLLNLDNQKQTPSE